MTDWRTHVAIAAAVCLVAAVLWLRARRRNRRPLSEPVYALEVPVETHISADGMLKADVFQGDRNVLRVKVYVKQDDGPFGQPWIPHATSYADRETLDGVLRDALQGDYT